MLSYEHAKERNYEFRMKRFISITLAVTLLVLGFTTPSSAMNKYFDAVFLASDETLSDDYVSVSVSQKTDSSFKVSSSDTIVITAANGATIRSIYLTKTESGQPTGKRFGSLVAAVGVCALFMMNVIGGDNASPSPNSLSGALVTTHGRVIPSNEGFTIQDINADSLELKTTSNEISISSIEVLYSLPMSKEDIIAEINLTGEEYLKAKDTYESASQSLSDKQSAFEKAEKEYNDKKDEYEKAQDAWTPVDAQFKNVNTAYQNALSNFNSAKNQYISDRNAYLPLYAQAKADLAALNNAAGLSEGDGLPEFVSEDTSIAPAAPSATPAVSPALRTNGNQSFENPMLSSDFVDLTARTGQVTGYKYYIVNNSNTLTLTGKQGTLINSASMHLMDMGESQGRPGAGGLSALDSFGAVTPVLAVSNGQISKKGDGYTISNVNSDSLTLTMTNNASIQILKIDVSYARPLTKDELIAKINTFAAPFKSSKELALGKLSDLNTAKAEYDSLLPKYNEAKASWDKAVAEWQTAENTFKPVKEAFDNARSALEKAESEYNGALIIYKATYEEAKAELEEADLPAYLLGEGGDATATIISQGYPEIVYGVGGLAVGFFAAMLIFRKKKNKV